jgi:hypothetical protein
MAEREVMFSREAAQLALKLAEEKRIATSHAQTAAEVCRGFERLTVLFDEREAEVAGLRLSLAAARNELAEVREKYAWLVATLVAAPEDAELLVLQAGQLASEDAADRRVAVYLQLCADAVGMTIKQIAEAAQDQTFLNLGVEDVEGLLRQGAIDSPRVETLVAAVVGADSGKMIAQRQMRERQSPQASPAQGRSARSRYRGRHRATGPDRARRPPVARRTRSRRLTVSRGASTLAALALALAVLTGSAGPTARGGLQRRLTVLVWMSGLSSVGGGPVEAPGNRAMAKLG